MAIRTFNPSGSSDNWSTASAWGGTIPADGDSFIISAGKTCYMDVDQSAMATGMIAGTVNGTLCGPNGAGTGVLKMDGVGGHDLTIASNGSLIHGASKSSPAPSNSVFKILLGTASEIKVAGNDRTVKLHPTVKSIRYARLLNDASSGTNTITLDRTLGEVSADGWAAGDYVCVCRPTTTGNTSDQLFTISAIGGGSSSDPAVLQLSGTLNALTPAGCYVINHSSNIMILTTRSSGTECVFDCNYACPLIEFGGNVVNTTVTTNYTNAGGYGVGQLTNTLGKAHQIYGTFHGCANGINYSRGTNVEGAVFTACANAVARLVKSVLDVAVFSCCTAISGLCADCYLPSTSILFGCAYPLMGMGNMQFGGKIKGCLSATIGYSGSILSTADIGGTSNIDRNFSGTVDFGDGGSIVFQEASTSDSTKVFNYKSVGVSSGVKACVAMYNYGGQAGRHWFYTAGGYTSPDTDVDFEALGYPSCERTVFEWNAALNFVDLPVEIMSGQPFYIQIDVKLGSGSYSFAEVPSFAVVDSSLPFESPSAVLATAVRADGSGLDAFSAAMQRLWISFVPAPTAEFPYGSRKPAILRMKGRGGNPTGTGTDYIQWAYTQAQSVVADVRSLAGSSSALTNLLANVDVPVSTRLAAASYVAPDNAGISAIRSILSSDAVITVVSPVVEGSVITVARGYDYKAVDGRAVEFTSSAWPNLTGASSVAMVRRDPARTLWHPMSVAASGTGVPQTVRLEMDDSFTASLTPGSHPLRVAAVLANGDAVDLLDVDVLVK